MLYEGIQLTKCVSDRLYPIPLTGVRFPRTCGSVSMIFLRMVNKTARIEGSFQRDGLNFRRILHYYSVRKNFNRTRCSTYKFLILQWQIHPQNICLSALPMSRHKQISIESISFCCPRCWFSTTGNKFKCKLRRNAAVHVVSESAVPTKAPSESR